MAKFVIASDIHGSAYWCKKLLTEIEAQNPDKVILLGDILYHGPRNALPRDYDPQSVAAMLNNIQDKIVCVRGNCDAEVDQMVLDFDCMASYTQLFDGTQLLYATHGHLASPDKLPSLPQQSIFLYGHTHVKQNAAIQGITCFNPGSVSIPKDGSHSYGIWQQNELSHVILNED